MLHNIWVAVDFNGFCLAVSSKAVGVIFGEQDYEEV